MFYYYWGLHIVGYEEYVTPEWWMVKTHHYYRGMRVQQERREWFKAKELSMEYGFKLTRDIRNPYYINPWTIEKHSSRYVMKSWKALNKCRKQWQKKKYKQEFLD